MKRLATLLLTVVLLLSSIQSAHADDSLRVYYAGADGSVKTALELAKFTLVTDPAQADVFVLVGEFREAEWVGGGDRGRGWSSSWGRI